ncbi:MAG: (4Fe-4S)-binding protein [Deltaproteobacteria bacterium]|nr:MAG: (4Fe-4S)-binding protein [Deltaproteobacteria bacterium]
MKELTVISGKGGTGKTSLVAAFANLAENKVIVDGDVDAADLHLILRPEVKIQEEFKGGRKARINPDLCTACGQCIELCQFQAISRDYVVDEFGCEGCGVCVHFCPVEAIEFPENICGDWFISETRFGPFVHAKLGIAAENSGKLITMIRRQAEKLAEERGLDMILIDGPPGIGCPVIAATTGATAALVVTEPTISGIHDLQRVGDLSKYFQIPVMVCINKFDINPDVADRIEKYCVQEGFELVGKIPYDPVFTQAMIAEKTIIEYSQNGLSDMVREMWEKIMSTVNSI